MRTTLIQMRKPHAHAVTSIQERGEDKVENFINRSGSEKREVGRRSISDFDFAAIRNQTVGLRAAGLRACRIMRVEHVTLWRSPLRGSLRNKELNP